MVADIDSYSNKVNQAANVIAELSFHPWGIKDFRIEDSFGYYIRITSLHNILNDPNTIAD